MPMAAEEIDCTDGCSHPDEFHKWEIEPNPHNNDFDVYVTDDDADALASAKLALENGWDNMEVGETFTVVIKMNKPASPSAKTGNADG
jgi:hypothetical protein